MPEMFPPALVLLLGALALWLAPGRWRDVVVLGFPAATLAAIWLLPADALITMAFLDGEIAPLKMTVLGRLFATIFALMALVGGLFALRQASTAELSAAFLYASSAIGVALAGDLISMFVFWEVMALGSALVIWAANTTGARQAGIRYLLVHLFGGVILMIGIEAEIARTGSTAFQAMTLDSVGRWLILIGFLINAAAPPLAAWLSDAYPEASPTGTVFLSAFTTKAAVYALMVAFPGTAVLVPIGLVMIFYGIIYALLENDMRRILAYSIVNQVGFMVTGIGIGTPLALNGVAAHAFCHIIYKALLMMSAGAVLYRTGKRKCTDLGGLFQSMPVTTICAIIGALAISSFPLTSGFVSKNMISEAAGVEMMPLVYFLLAAASAGVFLHAGIKFPWFVFFQKDSGMRPKDPPWNMQAAMIVFSAFSIGLGVYATPLYQLLPYPVDYTPYAPGKVVFYLQLLLFSGLAFFVMLPWMKRTLTITLDADWLYRRLFARIGDGLWSSLAHVYHAATARLQQALSGMGGQIDALCRPRGLLTRTWYVSTTAVWLAGLLSFYLIIYYF